MTSATEGRDLELVQRHVEQGATLQLGSMDRLYPIPVSLVAVEPASGLLTLRTQCDVASLDHFLLGESLALDAEIPLPEGFSRCFSLEDLEGDWQPVDDDTCEIRCEQGLATPGAHRPGGMRVPFVCGMEAEASLTVFEAGKELAGRVLDLSASGCRVQVPVRDATVFAPGQQLARVILSFPNGEVFRTTAEVRQLRPMGELYHVAIGLQFSGLDVSAEQRLQHFVSTAEMELAWRLGVESRGSRPTELFHARDRLDSDEGQDSRYHREYLVASLGSRDVFIQGVREVCRKLYTIAICLRSERWFPVDLLESAARDLLVLLESDRSRLLYALGCLQGEPRWMRHTIEVAAAVGDVMAAESEWQEAALEGVAGILLHSLGKPLLQGRALPALDGPLSDQQRCLLRGHVEQIVAALDRVGWEPGPVTLDVLANINERLDGSGYPAGKTAADLSPLARMASVIKMANKLLHPAAGQRPGIPLEAYRWLNQHSARFDRLCVVRLIQRHGIYPIGSLVKFSHGFLGWVRDQDERGTPARVQVARNLAFPDATLSTMLSGPDLEQLGQPEAVVNAEDYRVPFPVVT